MGMKGNKRLQRGKLPTEYTYAEAEVKLNRRDESRANYGKYKLAHIYVSLFASILVIVINFSSMLESHALRP